MKTIVFALDRRGVVHALLGAGAPACLGDIFPLQRIATDSDSDYCPACVEPLALYMELDPAELLTRVKQLTGPAYKHDCSECVFLGRYSAIVFSSDAAQTWDLYYCDKAGYRTFIYRAGDDAPNYASVPEFALPDGPHPALFACVARARGR